MTKPLDQLPTLNVKQEQTADGFFNFLLNKEKFIRISGPGGSGKTFLMGHLIDIIMPRYFNTCALMNIQPEYDEVVMTATTNKAAEVLGLTSGRPASTIHTFLNLIIQNDYDTGKTKLARGKKWKVHHRKIIFIDEASMIDSDLFKMIQEGTHNCKIVFVGDHCQLPPVFENESKAFAEPMDSFILTEPMRTNNPVLQKINNQLRATVETGIFKPIQIVPGTIDLLDSDQMPAMIEKLMVDMHHKGKIIAYDNTRVHQYNEFVRELRNLPKLIQEGEILVNNSGIQVGSVFLSVEEEVTVIKANSSTHVLKLDGGAELEVLSCTIQTSYGDFVHIDVPVDIDHFNKLLKWYSKQKNWYAFFDLKNNYPDLRPRDACTTHKSQGSSYDFEFIDVGNISTCKQPDLAAKLLYVAFSRARHNIYLYGDLASKYGGLIQ